MAEYLAEILRGDAEEHKDFIFRTKMGQNFVRFMNCRALFYQSTKGDVYHLLQTDEAMLSLDNGPKEFWVVKRTNNTSPTLSEELLLWFYEQVEKKNVYIIRFLKKK